MLLLRLFISFLIIIGEISAMSNSQGSDLKEFLITVPFKDYRKDVFPRTDQSQSVDIEMDFYLVAITSFSEVSSTLEIIGSADVKWKSETLLWDLVTDNPTSELLLPQDQIWKPSLIVSNSVDSLSELGDNNYKIRIDSVGNNKWTLGIVTKTSCFVDITLYPYDKQTCEIIFTTWGYRSSQVALNTTRTAVDLTNYQENSEWSLESTKAEISNNNNQTYLIYTLNLNRQPKYFLINMIIPIIILGLLNGMVFLLPYDSGERVGYAITAFLTFAVFLTMVAENLPKASKPMSLLCYYLTLMLVMSAVATVLTIMNLRVYHQDDDKSVPNGLRHMVSFITCRKCKMWCSKKESKNAVRDIMENADIAAENEEEGEEVVEREGEDIKDINWKTVGATLDGIFFIMFFFASSATTGYFILPLIFSG